MPTKKFAVVVKGSTGGALTSVDVQLSGEDIALHFGDRTRYSNDGADVTYAGKLNIHCVIFAPNTTAWELTVTVVGSDEPCFKTNGQTGSDGNNKSIVGATSNC